MDAILFEAPDWLKRYLMTFETEDIRKIWHENEWYYSIIDIVSILIELDYQQARNYWKVLKYQLEREGNETVIECNQLKETVMFSQALEIIWKVAKLIRKQYLATEKPLLTVSSD